MKATLPDGLFRFSPPEGATRVEVTAFGPAGRTRDVAGRGQPSRSVALTDVKVGECVLPIKTQPVTVKAVAVPFQVDLMTNVAVR